MRSSILRSLKPDIIVEMLDMAVGFENWHKVLETADILYRCAQCIDEERRAHLIQGRSTPHIHTERPMLYYYAYSLEMKGHAHHKLGNVEEARAYIALYEALEWTYTLNLAEEQVVRAFKHKAQVNRFALDIGTGQMEHLKAYMDFLQDHPEERVKGLTTILEAAVRYRWEIDEILHTFSDSIEGSTLLYNSDNNEYINNNYSLHPHQYDDYYYYYRRTMYEEWRGRPQEAVEYILQALRLAHELEMDRHFKQCTVQLEWLREAATKGQLELYRDLLRQIG